MNEVSVIKEGWLHKRGKGSLRSANCASPPGILLPLTWWPGPMAGPRWVH